MEMKSLVKRNIIHTNGVVNRCTRSGNVTDAAVVQMFSVFPRGTPLLIATGILLLSAQRISGKMFLR